MRKWLVGLLALACIGATTWAETATYTVTSKTEVTLSGTAPDGATAVYEQTANNMGQATANNTLKLTLKGYDGTTITGLKLSMKSNASKGAGSLSVTCGDAIIAGIENSKFNSENWNGAWSAEYVDIVPAVTATAVDGDVVILISATENSLYCQSYTVEYTAGDPVFSVKFDKENWFKVAQGQASSVTAIPQYGIEPYTFLWSCDKASDVLTGTEATLVIPDTLDEGDYTLNCEVKDANGEGDVINKQIGFTVAAIPVITGGSATYTVTGKSKVEASGDVPTGSTAEYSQTYGTAGQATKENSMTLTLKGYEGMTITGLTLSMKSNKSSGSGSLSVTCEDAVIASIEDSAFNVGWSDAYTQEYVDVTPEVTPTAVTGDVTITIAASVNSLYCQSYTVQFEAGEPGLSVTLDKANGFTVDVGTADSITATAKNGAEPYTYAWTSDTPDLNGTGETLAIPATLAEGDYTVQVEVTDAESNKANKQIYFSVVAPLEPHAINIAVGIQNGTVTSDPEGEAVKGTQVKLTATATTEGYALKEMTVTYGETVLTFTASPATFEMPDEAVSVGATFEEVKDYAELPFVAEDTPYSGPWKTATVSGMTSKGLGNDYTSGGAVGARLDDTGDWLQIKFQGTAGELSYGIKGNSLSEEKPSTFKVQESADGETWADLATFTTGDNLTGSTVGYTNEVSSSSQFVRFFYEEKGAGNVGIYDVYITSGGPAVFSITLDPAKDFEVEQNAEAFVTAIPKHAAEGVVGYAWWIDGTPVETAGEVLALATAELGPHKVICEATDAAGAKADAHVIYTVVAPAVKYAVNVALGIQNGTVTTDVSEAAEGDPVTVTATPADGYRLVEIIVNNGEVAVSGNTFVMPAQDVLVTATFEEFEVPPYYFQFETGPSIAYAATEAEFANTGSTAEGTPTVAFNVQRTTKGKDAGDKVVGEYALRLAPIGETNAFAYNSAAFSEAITAISFQYGIYGTSDKCDSFTVSTSEDGENWTILADLTESATAELQTFESSELPDNTLFVRFDAANTVKGNTRRMDIDEIMLWTGAPSPKITYTGDTTIELGNSFSIQFALQNYDGDFEWVLDSREGGTISSEGEYTWYPTAAGDVTIKVVARNGELDIASKEVALTVTEPGPQPGEPALVFGGDTEGTVGTPVNFTVTSVNVVTDPTVYPDGFVTPGGSTLTDDNIDYGEEAESRNVSFTPDVPGDYVFTFVAGAEGAADEVRESVTITVTGEGPQPGEAGITKMTIAAGKMTIEFTGTAPQVLLSDDMQTWTAVDGAISPFEFNMDEAGKKYIGVR